MAATGSSDLTILRRLLRQARAYWLHIGGAFALELLATPLSLLTPLPLMLVVDHVIGTRPLPPWVGALLPATIAESRAALLAIAVGLVVAIAALTQLQGLAKWVLQTYTGERLVLDLRTRLFSHAQRLSVRYHDRRGTADAIYRIQYDASSVQWILIYGIGPLVTAVATVTAMLYITARIDGRLALVAVAVAPILLALIVHYRDRLREEWRAVKSREATALAVVQEVLTSLRVVKAFGREAHEERRFVRHAHDGLGARIRVVLSESRFSLLVGVTTAAGTAAVLWIGAHHVQAGELTLGELLLVMAYLAKLYDPLKTLGKQVASLQGSFVGAERILSLLDEAPEVPERHDARSLVRARGAFLLRDVSFAYDPRTPVLSDVSLAIPAGTRVGIAGRTGAGKTTFVSLLTRFFDPTTGAIELDGVDLRDYRLADLRQQFAIVLQEPVLFSTTIAENIAYARPEASEAEIVRAARAANAHDFITALPDGYATVVGERGMRLSGGERQRIGLARAFLKDAPILILDEPTSAVDLTTEGEIMATMARLMEGRTTFMIAHRISTLDACDVLLEIEEGRVAQVTSTMGVSGGGTVVTAAIRGLPRPSREGHHRGPR